MAKAADFRPRLDFSKLLHEGTSQGPAALPGVCSCRRACPCAVTRLGARKGHIWLQPGASFLSHARCLRRAGVGGCPVSFCWCSLRDCSQKKGKEKGVKSARLQVRAGFPVVFRAPGPALPLDTSLQGTLCALWGRGDRDPRQGQGGCPSRVPSPGRGGSLSLSPPAIGTLGTMLHARHPRGPAPLPAPAGTG